MERLYGYQDASFEVHEVGGHALRRLDLFVGQGDAPKFLGVLADGRCFHYYIDAWLGFWSGLHQQEYEDVVEDYNDCERIDYAAKYNLAGQVIERASCDRTESGTSIEVRLEAGTVRLFELDPSDPDSDCGAEFIPHSPAP